MEDINESTSTIIENEDESRLVPITQRQMIVSKKIGEKQTFTYRKLVVPMSMRSIYWKYFGFPATEEGDILTKIKIVCILCKSQIAYNKNTSNLRMHLQNKHNQELMELEATLLSKKVPITQPMKEKKQRCRKLIKAYGNQHIYATSVDGTIKIDGGIQFVADSNVSLSTIEEDVSLEAPVGAILKQEESPSPSGSSQNVAYVMPDDSPHDRTISDAIAEFIIMDLQLPDIVEGRGFQRLIATLGAPCEIPDKYELEDEIIPKIYETFRESLNTTITSITGEIGLTVEEWQSNCQKNFLTVSMYYQNHGESALETRVLRTVHAPADSGEAYWTIVFDSILHDWNLSIEKISAVVVATMKSEIVSALTAKGFTVVPCLLHTLQICVQACFEIPEVAEILTRCRTIIGTIANNHTALSTLNMQQQLLEMDENLMVIDYPAVWISSYNMLERMMMRSNIITSIFDNVDDINQEGIELTNDQWKIIQDLVAVLEPLKVTIMTLSEEKMPLVSLLKPLIWQLVSSHLKAKPSDSDIAKSFKELLSDMLIERYSDSGISLFLQIATALDPRFKQLPYATQEDKNIATEPIKKMLKEIIEENQNNEQEAIKSPLPPVKKTRLSGMALLLGNLCSVKTGMTAQEKAGLELIQYESEPTAALDDCPLQWWLGVSSKCPNLCKLARRYNCVPACCAPPSKIPAEAQIMYDRKRAAVPPHIADKLIFLHNNHTV